MSGDKLGFVAYQAATQLVEAASAGLSPAQRRAEGEALSRRPPLDALLFLIEKAQAKAIAPVPLSRARVRGVMLRRRMLEGEGGAVTAPDLGKLMGITRQAVDKKRGSGQLLAIPVGRSYVYPLWQIDADGRPLKGLAEALKLLPPQPWSRFLFFVGEEPALGDKRPLDALRKGQVELVLRSARQHGEQGAR